MNFRYTRAIMCIMLCFATSACTISSVSATGETKEKIIEKTLYFNLENDNSTIAPYASTTYQRHTVDTFTDTVRGKKLQANVTLKVTIRVNESNGVISSYSGPYLNQNWIDVGAYQGYLIDSSTEASLSSTKRTLHCIGRFKIYAVSAVGTDPHTSKEFKIEFNAQ